MKMRECVSNKMSANKMAETDKGNSVIKLAKKYLHKRIAESAYSFVLT